MNNNISNKEKIAVSVAVLSHTAVVTTSSIDSDEKYVVVIGDTACNDQIAKAAGATLVEPSFLRKYFYDKRLVTFNAKQVDQYLIRSIVEGKDIESVKWIQNEIVVNKVKPYKLTPKQRGLFGNFDITSLLQQGTGLEEVAGRMGLSIADPELFLGTSRVLKTDELDVLVKYLVTRADNIKKVFNHPYVTAGYRQHLSMIDRYLDGKEQYFSMTGAQLAMAAITRNNTFKNHKKQTFDWILNGRNILEHIPEMWASELKEYQQKMELAMKNYLAEIADGKSSYDAGKVFKDVPFPSDKFLLGEDVEISYSGGGLHTKRVNQKMVRAKKVKHYDIEGAYTEIILAKKIFSPEIEQIYRGCKIDKFNFKKMKKIFEAAEKSGMIDVFDILDKVRPLGLDLPGTPTVGELKRAIEEGVEASKLATNESTGNADRNGTVLYNPIGMTEGRICLQVALYDLAKRLHERGADILSINTDGVFCDPKGLTEAELSEIVSGWEVYWGLKIGAETIDYYIAKSNNDRILINNATIVEAKGDDLVHYELANLKKLGTKPRVVDQVVLEKLIHPDRALKDIFEKRIQSGIVSDFAFCTKAQRGTKTVFDLKVEQRVNRFLLTTSGEEVRSFSIKTGELGKVANVPNNARALLCNDKLPESLPDDLDEGAYLELIEAVYQHWV